MSREAATYANAFAITRPLLTPMHLWIPKTLSIVEQLLESYMQAVYTTVLPCLTAHLIRHDWVAICPLAI